MLPTPLRGVSHDGDGQDFLCDCINDRTFLNQIQLGSRTVVLNEQEVEDRMASR